MSAKFTPGPWTLGKGKVTIRETRETGSKGFIARCHMPGEWRYRSEEESEANARLIAAAPDLYAALREVLDDWEAGFKASETPSFQRALSAYQSAAQ